MPPPKAVRHKGFSLWLPLCHGLLLVSPAMVKTDEDERAPAERCVPLGNEAVI